MKYYIKAIYSIAGYKDNRYIQIFSLDTGNLSTGTGPRAVFNNFDHMLECLLLFKEEQICKEHGYIFKVEECIV